MSKTEILAELPKLAPAELVEIQAKLDELFGESWIDNDELSDADRPALDAALVDYHQNPDAGSSWEDIKARVQDKLRP